MSSKGSSLSRKKEVAIVTRLLYLWLSVDIFFLVSSDWALDWWVYFLKSCAYPIYCSEAGEKCRQVIQTDFIFCELMLQNSLWGINCKQAHRRYAAMQRSWEDFRRKSKYLFCTFLGSVLIMSNSRFQCQLSMTSWGKLSSSLLAPSSH